MASNPTSHIPREKNGDHDHSKHGEPEYLQHTAKQKAPDDDEWSLYWTQWKEYEILALEWQKYFQARQERTQLHEAFLQERQHKEELAAQHRRHLLDKSLGKPATMPELYELQHTRITPMKFGVHDVSQVDEPGPPTILTPREGVCQSDMLKKIRELEAKAWEVRNDRNWILHETIMAERHGQHEEHMQARQDDHEELMLVREKQHHRRMMRLWTTQELDAEARDDPPHYKEAVNLELQGLEEDTPSEQDDGNDGIVQHEIQEGDNFRVVQRDVLSYGSFRYNTRHSSPQGTGLGRMLRRWWGRI